MEPAAGRHWILAAMRYFKYFGSLAALGCWLIGGLLSWPAIAYTPSQQLRLEAVLVLAVGYSLAVLFLVSLAWTQRAANEEARFGLGMKFPLSAPAALAAAISVATTIASLRERKFCSIIDCFSLHGFLRYHLPYFSIEFTVFSVRLYAAGLIAVVLVGLIRMIQRVT